MDLAMALRDRPPPSLPIYPVAALKPVYQRGSMATWVHTITYPLRKACGFFASGRNRKAHPGPSVTVQMDLHGQVMACGYEDVRVMWSMLKQSGTGSCIA
ncbi:unnamed protein product [Victoria cruziana]